MSMIHKVILRGLIASGAILACSKPVEPTGKMLPLVNSFPLSIAEPSGLTLDETRTTLWTVTNNPDKVYQLDLTGKVTKTLNYVGKDLEGIAYDSSDSTLWVCEEASRELVHLDLNGDVLGRRALDLTGEANSGLEGLCFDDTGSLFALNEKRPGLFLTLDSELKISGRKVLAFAKDYSGLSFNRQSGCFWIVSDQSRRLYLWDHDAGVIDEYSFTFPKAEGIAFDDVDSLIYVVSDSENRLYVYRAE